MILPLPEPSPSENFSEIATNEESLREQDSARVLFFDVYAGLTFQFLFYFASTSIALYVPSVQEFAKSVYWTACGFLGVAFVVILVTACLQRARRSYPCNLLLLIVLTYSLAVFLGMFAAKHDLQEFLVLISFTLIANIMVIITILTIISNVFCLCNTVIFFQILLYLWTVTFVLVHALPNMKVQLAIGCIFADLVSIYIFFTTKRIIRGRYGHLVTPKWIQSVLTVYAAVPIEFQTLLRRCLGLEARP
ncbi:uncharacterized protein LOC106668076 [Cimex lectularius]|uniref:Uncharacterized protein n=1 Tax=Cimex lectularius TaxID=79782 RepID=A0A8I6RXT7_CIMLE|nr:uncharacterized protein LOC106668076 [Cimex lectularius]